MAFYRPQRELWCVVHGDDFTFSGYDAVTWAEQLMKSKYEIKMRVRLGQGDKDLKEIDVLGPRSRWRAGANRGKQTPGTRK